MTEELPDGLNALAHTHGAMMLLLFNVIGGIVKQGVIDPVVLADHLRQGQLSDDADLVTKQVFPAMSASLAEYLEGLSRSRGG